MTTNPKHANPQHSSATHRWGTERDVVERGRRVMGGITFDPCSEELFNKVVQADVYYSYTERGENGLLLPWPKDAKTLLNPPGEEKGKPRVGYVRKFWEKMLVEPIEQCVYVGFSMEQLGILADASAHPSDFSICYLRNRIKFNRHDRPEGEGSPSHANFVCLIGGDHDAFVREFGPLGKVQKGPLVR